MPLDDNFKWALSGQRLIARDGALREWRKEQVRPVFEYLHTGVQLAQRIDFAVYKRDEDAFESIRSEHRAGDLAFHAPTLYTVQDPTFNVAVLKLHEAESLFWHAVDGLGDRGELPGYELLSELTVAVIEAWGEVRRATEGLIFGV